MTYGLYRIKWLRGVSVSLALVGIPFATEGPERGVVDNYLINVLLKVRR